MANNNTGLFANLVPAGQTPTSGTTSSGLSVGDLVQVRNAIWGTVLPAGRLKTALMTSGTDLGSVFKTLLSLVQGRKYSQGEYTLGERLVKQIQCNMSVDWRSIPDDLVPVARKVFTILYGVPMYNDADFGYLAQGVDAYMNVRPWANRAAVQRAVNLVNIGYGPSTFNQSCWNLSTFDQYPLVAPVPNMVPDDEQHTQEPFYTGPGFNGQNFVNGMLASGPASNLTSNITSGSGMSTASMAGVSTATLSKYAPLFALLIVVGVIISVKTGLYKPNL